MNEKKSNKIRLAQGILITIIFIFINCSISWGYELDVNNLICDYRINPIGVDNRIPSFGWQINVLGERSIFQESYQILVASTKKKLDQNIADIWDSGIVKDNNSIKITFKGKNLLPSKKYYWKVRIKDTNGVTSNYSETAYFVTGLFDQEDWHADWIYCANIDSSDCPWVRKKFILERVPKDAFAFVGSVGYHELYVNGEKVSDAVLTPSVSDLRKRVLYVTYDISSFLEPGENMIGIWLASGWANFRDFNPEISFEVKRKPLVIAQFHLGDGLSLTTDDTWEYSKSDTKHIGKWENGNFGGDYVDSNLSCDNWSVAYCIDRNWFNVDTYDPGLQLSSDNIEPNKMVKTVSASSKTMIEDKKYRFEMDKLFTGFIEAKLRGAPGDTIIIAGSTRKDMEIEFNQKNIYIIGSTGEGIFRNRFTYHAVQYVTIEGLNSSPKLTDVKGIQIYNDRKTIGGFDCSNRMLNQIYDITRYNYENLSTGGMTVDCPHRERLGYGGDGYTSLELALDAYSSYSFFKKWARDWCDIQDSNGRIYHSAPTLGGGGGPAWSGFVLTMPWEVFLAYGDIDILKVVYPTVVKWLEYLQNQITDEMLLGIPCAGNLNYMQGDKWLFLGDWVTPHGSERSETPEAALFNNCYYVYILKIASKVANILGDSTKGKLYLEAANKIGTEINKRFFNEKECRYLDGRQLHYIMPLVAKIVPLRYVNDMHKNLEHEILVTQKGHFDTGLHGTYFMVGYLAEIGRNDLIYTMTNQRSYPGYGDFICKGYRTWPEIWGGSFSQMHGCYNSIGGWFQRGLAGIKPKQYGEGYRNIVIQPSILGDLAWVNAYHESLYGRIIINWKRNANELEISIVVPPNTIAEVVIPTIDESTITEGGIPIGEIDEIEVINKNEGKTICKIGSGEYSFKSRYWINKDN